MNIPDFKKYELDFIPIIISNINNKSVSLKFLINKKLKVNDLSLRLKDKIVLKSDQNIFFIVNNKILNGNENLLEIYDSYKNKDKILIVNYSDQSSFGY